MALAELPATVTQALQASSAATLSDVAVADTSSAADLAVSASLFAVVRVFTKLSQFVLSVSARFLIASCATSSAVQLITSALRAFQDANAVAISVSLAV